MNHLYYLTLSHIFAGTLSLIVAPIAMVVYKGGRSHRLWGKIFFYAMTWVFMSSVILSIFEWIPFLLMLAVFSYYLVFTAYRVLYMKQLHLGKGVMWYDWVVVITAMLFKLFFLVWGVVLLVQGDQTLFAYLATFFGAGGLWLTSRGLRSLIRKPADKNYWFYSHIGNMVGGFIASVTAFSAQVMDFMPGLLQWLWPSLIGVPLIIYWIRSYRSRMAKGARLADLVELNHSPSQKIT